MINYTLIDPLNQPLGVGLTIRSRVINHFVNLIDDLIDTLRCQLGRMEDQIEEVMFL